MRKANNKNIGEKIFLILYLHNYTTVSLYKKNQKNKEKENIS